MLTVYFQVPALHDVGEDKRADHDSDARRVVYAGRTPGRFPVFPARLLECLKGFERLRKCLRSRPGNLGKCTINTSCIHTLFIRSSVSY